MLQTMPTRGRTSKGRGEVIGTRCQICHLGGSCASHFVPLLSFTQTLAPFKDGMITFTVRLKACLSPAVRSLILQTKPNIRHVSGMAGGKWCQLFKKKGRKKSLEIQLCRAQEFLRFPASAWEIGSKGRRVLLLVTT